MTESKQREAFEAWHMGKYGHSIEAYDTKQRWEGWQAALAQKEAQPMQYYYKVDGCTAKSPHHPECVCWHNEGSWPLRLTRTGDTAHEWRKKEAQPVEPVAWLDWRNGLAEKVDAYIRLQSENDDDEALNTCYAELKSHILSTPFRSQPVTHIEVLREALEALEYHMGQTRPVQRTIDAIAKLRAVPGVCK